MALSDPSSSYTAFLHPFGHLTTVIGDQYKHITPIWTHHNDTAIPVFADGKYQFDEFEVQIDICNPSFHKEQVYYRLQFANEKQATELFERIEMKVKKDKTEKEEAARYRVYHFDSYRETWKFEKSYKPLPQSELIGLDSIMAVLDNNLRLMKDPKVDKFLQSIGHTRSFNYLLHGKVGCGKSSLIRAFCTKHKLDMYKVEAARIGSDTLQTVLNGTNKEDDSRIRVIVLEDFDRWFDVAGSDISGVLNTLDGLNVTSNCIRFFTANDVRKTKSNQALMSRISNLWEFEQPSIDVYVQKFNRLLNYHTEQGRAFDVEFHRVVREKICKEANKKKLSVRRFELFILQHLFEEKNFLELMVNNIKAVEKEF